MEFLHVLIGNINFERTRLYTILLKKNDYRCVLCIGWKKN